MRPAFLVKIGLVFLISGCAYSPNLAVVQNTNGCFFSWPDDDIDNLPGRTRAGLTFVAPSLSCDQNGLSGYGVATVIRGNSGALLTTRGAFQAGRPVGRHEMSHLHDGYPNRAYAVYHFDAEGRLNGPLVYIQADGTVVTLACNEGSCSGDSMPLQPSERSAIVANAPNPEQVSWAASSSGSGSVLGEVLAVGALMGLGAFAVTQGGGQGAAALSQALGAAAVAAGADPASVPSLPIVPSSGPTAHVSDRPATALSPTSPTQPDRFADRSGGTRLTPIPSISPLAQVNRQGVSPNSGRAPSQAPFHHTHQTNRQPPAQNIRGQNPSSGACAPLTTVSITCEQLTAGVRGRTPWGMTYLNLVCSNSTNYRVRLTYYLTGTGESGRTILGPGFRGVVRQLDPFTASRGVIGFSTTYNAECAS